MEALGVIPSQFDGGEQTIAYVGEANTRNYIETET